MFYERSGYHFFSVGRIDVFVSMWYLILMAFIIFQPFGGGVSGGPQIAEGILYAAAVTVALLIHEFGHALISRRQGLGPSILLHGFGGLCLHEPAETDGKDAIIVAAGPAAGFLLAVVAFGILQVPAIQSSTPALTFFQALLWVSLVWNAVNVFLPIWPLDGGKLFHLLLRRGVDESQAREVTLQASIGTTVLGVLGLYAVTGTFSLFLTILAFFIVMSNWRALQSGQALVQRRADAGQPDDFHVEKVEEAERAMESGDFDEAYRLCHQLRATGGRLSEEIREEVWRILAISSTEIGRCDEAESYFERAPQTQEIQRAREKCQQKSAD
jgi:Zn-dependent protease